MQIVLIEGDGIGPEVTTAARRVVAAAGVRIDWVKAPAGLRAAEQLGEPLPDETLEMIRRYRVDPKHVDQIVTRARNGFLPLVSHLPGFACYSILDAGNGTLLTLSGFTTHGGAAESVTAAATFVKEHLSSLVPSPPEVTAGEVKLVERAR